METKELFFNRDLSWLKFNERVLHQAYDVQIPLLERLRFLAIFNSNLDEFIMKRIGYLNRLVLRGVNRVGSDDQIPEELLSTLRKEVAKISKKRDEYLQKTILPELKKEGVHVLTWADLSKTDKEEAAKYFLENVFPVLTPLAIDPAHPFPFLSNLSFSIAVELKDPNKKESFHARIKVPSILPAWYRLQPSETKPHEYRMLPLVDIIRHHLPELFPDMELKDFMFFRVVRNADINQVSDDIGDLLDVVEEELRQRRLAEIIRLEYSSPPMKSMLALLKKELELDEDDMYPVEGSFIHHILGDLSNIPLQELHYKSFVPSLPESLKEEASNMLDILKKRDVLVHHPYESFSASVERFLKDSVEDPNVFAIKITLYRAGDNSPLIPLLIRAAEKDKQVVCVLELQARFDEARNIYLGELLENAGIHVVYGIVGLKTHCKTAMVIRKEKDKFRIYAHIGTGNYNSSTAKQYTDFSLFTSDKKLTSELVQVFNYLTGLSLKKDYKHLLVSPVNMRSSFLDLIEQEIKAAKNGKPAQIIAKMNSLEDSDVMKKLYKASKEGVQIDLIVRGFCCLRPQVKGLSEKIRVYSTVGRLLEHSRIYYFRAGAKTHEEGKFFIGSADWMHRNLNKRVELIAPVLEPDYKKDLWEVLQTNLSDKSITWELKANGEYEMPKSSTKDLDMHSVFVLKYKNPLPLKKKKH